MTIQSAAPSPPDRAPRRARRRGWFLAALTLGLTLAAALVPPAPPPAEAQGERRDVLLLREGAIREGRLDGCTEHVCTLDGSPTPRAGILFIGLGVVGFEIPEVRDYLRDEVHFTDESFRSAKLLQVDARTVATDQGPFARKRVAWIYLAPPAEQTGAPAPAPAPEEDRPTYLWEGTIEVENAFNGVMHKVSDQRGGNIDVHGRHRWRASFFLRFEEVWGTSMVHDRAGNTVHLNDIVPREMSYTIVADQNWWVDNPYRDDDVTYRGKANATLPEEQIVRDRVLLGAVARLDQAPRIEQPRVGCMSEQDYNALVGEDGAGRYRLTIGFPPSPPAEARAYYRGIERGGGKPVRDEPDADFLRWLPAFMPDGVNVVGRLRRPDQAEVRGSLCFEHGGLSEWGRPRITITWSFTRTRR